VRNRKVIKRSAIGPCDCSQALTWMSVLQPSNVYFVSIGRIVETYALRLPAVRKPVLRVRKRSKLAWSHPAES
jgi:hypothetical protein